MSRAAGLPGRGAPRHRTQRGAALIVAMVMLFAMSILGVSAMRGATLERQMMNNAVQISIAFQSSESTTEQILNDPANLAAAFALDGDELPGTVDLQLGAVIESEGTLSYVGDGPALGFSLGEGSNNFMALRFRARGETTLDAVSTYSRVSQGAYRVVPAP